MLVCLPSVAEKTIDLVYLKEVTRVPHKDHNLVMD